MHTFILTSERPTSNIAAAYSLLSLPTLCRVDPCYEILSRLHTAHSAGTREPSDAALTRCLMDMLRLEGRPVIYIVVDALDECPNSSGMPTPREKVLEFLEDLVNSQLSKCSYLCFQPSGSSTFKQFSDP